MKVAIYTANIGGYDEPNFGNPVQDGVPRFYFSDELRELPPGWHFWRVPPEADPRQQARKIKVLGHLWLREFDVLIWMDANISLLVDPATLLETFLPPGIELGAFDHPYRTSILEEIGECIALGNTAEDGLRSLMRMHEASMRSERLFETGVLVRRSSVAMDEAAMRWWTLMSRYSMRDQVTAPIAYAPILKLLNTGNVRDHPFFDYRTHKKGT